MRPEGAGNRILTHRDWQPEVPQVRQYVALTRRRCKRKKMLTDEVAASPVVAARVNHGNWIADCPFCTGAELIDPEDLRFWCLGCDMVANGGKWLRVQMPDKPQRQQIEAVLGNRANYHHRNWTTESLEALKAENQENGEPA